MLFLSSANRAKYVVRQKDRILQAGVIVPQRGLTARFYNHRFDSENAQRDLGWTDEQRLEVERHLLTHKDFGMPGGIYLDEVVEGKGSIDVSAIITPTDVPAARNAVRCIEFFRDPETKEAVQCPNQPVEGSDYCSAHQRDEAEPEPVAAGVEGD